MVPATATPGDRFVALFACIPNIPFAAVDRAAGAPEGTAKQLATGRKAGPVAAKAFAPVFGVLAEWLLLGIGDAPGKRAVRAAVEASVAAERAARRGGAHAPRLATRARPRKLNARPAARA